MLAHQDVGMSSLWNVVRADGGANASTTVPGSSPISPTVAPASAPTPTSDTVVVASTDFAFLLLIGSAFMAIAF